jgi:arsenical pump membrane protein
MANPANLVVYDGALPPLGEWVRAFLLPSAVAIGVTYVAMLAVWGRDFAAAARVAPVEPLDRAGRIAGALLAASVVALVAAATLRVPLGATAAACGAGTLCVMALVRPAGTLPALRGISWAVVPLVGGLFVIVTALGDTGVGAWVSGGLAAASRAPWPIGSVGAGVAVAAASNAINNLPVALAAGAALGHATPQIAHAAVVGIDLGPNAAVSGSLATLLWMEALRREGVRVSALEFLHVGLVVTVPALVLATLVVR